MQIGPYTVSPAVALAPMAGITDKPFRMLARQFGAGWTVGEMISSNPDLQNTRKTLSRIDRSGESGVIAVQIAGSNPAQMAEAARYNVAQGAQLIDINMGCPAKKVCQVQAGSALLQNEPLVAEILHAVVRTVDVPVTLKTRLGWHDEHKNILTIARMAEDAGIAAIAIHGRTRTQMYRGQAEYGLIAEAKRRLSIPVWVNGDIDSPQKAARVLAETGTDGVMIGRAAQGRPWLFRDVAYYLAHGSLPPPLPFQVASEANDYTRRFFAAMNDDFDTVQAVAVLFELAGEANKTQSAELAGCLKALAGTIGLLQRNPTEFLQGGTPANGLSNEEIEALIARRKQARADKNWAESDRIRDLLAAENITLRDGADGTSWTRG